ncbi:nuclear transport factor 2 family protein [Saccharopolyspora sp. TS4A08]|uniref:Nuclear transport factor 2 family protein n=1 Tax=Saccharopolyspora ipomoeae TaxID=3042027 RepID=A0ABT6PMG3_9PSEU|nr:nuclear transport factor 2 family protein [Saccharopolyspora sp. TS4A08]MDI2029107.1 nuclear transport factor 2 family protein [Saccharopolyspora sp. TS4A08]
MNDVRPNLNDPAAQAVAEAVVGSFAAELQKGLDSGDADVYDRSFAADVMWGSPYGATLDRFEELSAAHHRLMAAAVAPRSRFEVVNVLAPAPGVAVAHIRRQALDGTGFSEMALYTLIERDGRWWLAAAQNTPIAQPPSS